MTYEISVEQRPAQPVLARRVHANVQDLKRVFGETYGALMQYLGALGEPPMGMPYAAYYNMDMQNLEVEIGFPVARAVPGRGDLQPGVLPAGDWAQVLHVGPYDQVGPAYDALAAWVAEHGREPSGVAYEMYLDGPETPPAQLRTWIMFPLKAAPEAVLPH
jgi:effector-binding domain-containing protein